MDPAGADTPHSRRKREINMNTNELVITVADKIINIKGNDPILVAFDGVDTSGKTTLANRIHDHFQKREIDSIRVSIDKFHNPKEIRVSKGDYSPEGFFYDSFNYEKIMELIINPVKNGKSPIINGIYDYRIENQISKNIVNITRDSIILFDGIFMNRDELFQYWDYSIFLDVSFDTVRKRAINRDKELFGSEEEVLNKYNKRYIPGEEIYINLCNPKDRANIVIDNNNWLNPVITKGNFI